LRYHPPCRIGRDREPNSLGHHDDGRVGEKQRIDARQLITLFDRHPAFFIDKLRQGPYILTIIIVNSNGAQIMQTLSLSEAKMKLSELVDRVHSTDEEVVITKNGRPAAVLVSPGEFESWKETIEILSSCDLMDEIRKGLAALRKRSKVYTLEELLD
jgi:antitoxin YefM